MRLRSLSFAVKLILALLIAFPFGPELHAQDAAPEELFCKKVIALVRLAPTDYRDNHGAVLRDNEAVKVYNAAAPYPELHAAKQGINVSKNGKAPFNRATYMGAEEVSYAQAAFLGIAAQLSLPGERTTTRALPPTLSCARMTTETGMLCFSTMA